MEASEVVVISSHTAPSGYCPDTRTGRARLSRASRRRSRPSPGAFVDWLMPGRTVARMGALMRQPAVLDAVRLVRVGAQPAVAVRLVVLVVALEPDHPAVALEGQHVGGDAVQEPAVVADD